METEIEKLRCVHYCEERGEFDYWTREGVDALIRNDRKENIDTAFKVANVVMEVKLESLIKELMELKIINPEKEPPKNKLTQNQVFQAGQLNVLIRIKVILDKYNENK